MVSTLLLMDAVFELEQMSFPEFLRLCLEEHQSSILELHDFLTERDFPIDRNGFYRYFNPNPKVYRKADKRFLCLFAEFLQLSPQQEAALYLMWRKKRREHLRSKLNE
jgi:hypothetical protein